jgi:hypothetical protein
MTDRENPIVRMVERILGSELYKTYEVLATLARRLLAPITFLAGLAWGTWHLMFTHEAENAPVFVVVKIGIFAISVCGALGLGLAVPLVLRNIFWSKSGLRWWDMLIGVPICLWLVFYLWYYRSSPYLMICTLTMGSLCFLMIVLLPALHRTGIINLEESPTENARELLRRLSDVGNRKS